jgi:hypothetical protein
MTRQPFPWWALRQGLKWGMFAVMLTVLVSPLMDEFVRKEVEGGPPLVAWPLERLLVVAFVSGIVTFGPSLVGGAALGLIVYHYGAKHSLARWLGWAVGLMTGVLVASAAWLVLVEPGPTNWVIASIIWEALIFGWIGNHLEQVFMQ